MLNIMMNLVCVCVGVVIGIFWTAKKQYVCLCHLGKRSKS